MPLTETETFKKPMHTWCKHWCDVHGGIQKSNSF